jgi:hypothetical protein
MRQPFAPSQVTAGLLGHRQAVGAWMGAMPASPMVAGFKEVQDRAAEIAKTNADSAFALVEKIAKTRNF